jgi:transcriptional regulator with XRE-family HTH domain
MEPVPAALVAAVLKHLAAERMKRGLTQEELAVRAGIDRSHVGLLEKGLRSPSLEVVLSLAWAMEIPLAGLLSALGDTTIEAGVAQVLAPPERVARRPLEVMLRKPDRLLAFTGLSGAMLLAAIEKTYATLDLIDAQLLRAKSPALAAIVELANLTSMLGNILGAAIADRSAGLYKRNGPHKFPDLLPMKPAACELEIKVALESNRPKGHLPKPGTYLSVRYVLGDRQGRHTIGARGDTIWIWEMKTGILKPEDFDNSNTAGDSGKTSVIKTATFHAMDVIFLDERFIPHKPRKDRLYPGHN